MKMSKKDQLYVAVVVPLALLLAYRFVWVRPLLREQRQLQGVEQRVGDRGSLMLRQGQLAREHQELQKMVAEVEKESEPLIGYDGKRVAVSGGSGSGLRRLHESFQRHEIRLISADSMVENNMRQSEDGVLDILKQSGVAQPRSWSVTLEASYSSLQQLLSECSTNSCYVVPVALSMQPGGSDNKTTYWTLRTCL